MMKLGERGWVTIRAGLHASVSALSVRNSWSYFEDSLVGYFGERDCQSVHA
jgi:hypothetical protein